MGTKSVCCPTKRGRYENIRYQLFWSIHINCEHLEQLVRKHKWQSTAPKVEATMALGLLDTDSEVSTLIDPVVSMTGVRWLDKILIIFGPKPTMLFSLLCIKFHRFDKYRPRTRRCTSILVDWISKTVAFGVSIGTLTSKDEQGKSLFRFNKSLFLLPKHENKLPAAILFYWGSRRLFWLRNGSKFWILAANATRLANAVESRRDYWTRNSRGEVWRWPTLSYTEQNIFTLNK